MRCPLIHCLGNLRKAGPERILVTTLLCLATINGLQADAAKGRSSPSNTPREDDIRILEQRVRHDLIEDGSFDDEQISRRLESMTKDGSWPQIDYGETARTDWAPQMHLERLREMAVAYNTESSRYHESEHLLDRVIAGLKFWYRVKPTSKNWWQTSIGEDLDLGPILVMLKEALPKKVIRQSASRLHSSISPHEGTDMDEILVDRFLIHRGLVLDKKETIQKAFDHLKEEIQVRPDGIGIKPDFSFHNHGPQLYNGGYGMGTIEAWAYWAYLARGTDFAFSKEKVTILSRLVLEGYRWMTWHKRLDYGAHGRGITRSGIDDTAQNLLPISRQMIKLLPNRQKSYQEYIRHIEGAPTSLIGNKNFPFSDFMTHRRPGWYASVKLTSQDVIGCEAGNGENRKAYYLPFGCNFIFQEGDEYANIFPVWDWTRIPGVTAPHDPPAPHVIDGMEDWAMIQGNTDFVGGVSNGQHGLTAFDYSRGEVEGRKAWFFFDDAFVALGAGIASSGRHPVYTSINQCLRDGKVVTSDTTQNAKSSPQLLRSPGWVSHDGIGYVFPREQSEVRVETATQSGSRKAIRLSDSDRKLSKEVFNVWIDHGKKPTHEKYHYIVAPDATPQALSHYIGDTSPFEVLANKRSMQGVIHRRLGLAMISFYEAGSLQINEKAKLKIDSPGLVMLARDNEATEITFADPRGQPAKADITVLPVKKPEKQGPTIHFDLNANQTGAKRLSETILETPNGTRQK